MQDQRDLTAKIDAYVKRVVAEAPPLTNEQRSRLRELLAPVRANLRAKALPATRTRRHEAGAA